MAALLRILVAGDKNFNNYFIAYPYLKEFISPEYVVITSGGTGIDSIAEIYAHNEKLAYEAYTVNYEQYGKTSLQVRNKALVDMCNYTLIFWDGKNQETESLITLAKRKFSKPTIIRYNENDIIQPHPKRVVNVKNDKCDIYCGRSSVYGNPFFLTNWNRREYVILQYTAYLMKNEKLINAILNIDPNKVLGCHCSPDLCHCDVICWLLDNATNDLKLILTRLNKKNDVSEAKAKKPPSSVESFLARMTEFETPRGLYSKHGIQVSEGWNQIVEDGWLRLIEIPDNKIIKSNLHLSKKTIDLLAQKDESEVVSVKYHTNETTNIPVVHCKVTFADSPYKEGYWYVDVRDVVNK